MSNPTTPAAVFPSVDITMKALLAGLVAGAMLLFTTVAMAQSGVQGAVGERKPFEMPGKKGGDLYEPLGLRRGSFLIWPHLNVTLEDDDNIYADDTRKVSDTVWVLNPGFNVRSLWSNHELKFWGDVFAGRYSDEDTEDFDDWRLGASGRIDIDRRKFIELGLELGEQRQDRSDPTDPDFDEPSVSDYYDLSANWYQQFNRLYYRVGARLFDEDFKNITIGDEVFNSDDLDHNRTTLNAEVGYEFREDYWAFARAEIESTDYDLAVDEQGINRDSDGDSLLAGVSIKLEDRVEGSIFVGRRSRDYDDAPRISGSLIGADLEWQPSRLTKIMFNVDRRIHDARSTDATGYLRRSYGVRAEHELYRNVKLLAGLGWYDDEYRGINRSDDGFSWSLGAQYLVNRWARVGLEFVHDDRDSSGDDALESNSYDRDVIRLKLELIR